VIQMISHPSGDLIPEKSHKLLYFFE